MRFFISYRRRAEADRTLANLLRDGLARSGHEVFIDVGMPVGTDWAQEIAWRIDWCDFLVILLSEESVRSEMIHGEARLAHQRRRNDGRPRILPIRIRYDGPLDYELDCYLGRLQYLTWTSSDDSEYILDSLEGVASSGVDADLEPNEQIPSGDISSIKEPERPLASVDPRLYTKQPGGGMKPADPFYVRREADDRIDEIAASTGETLVIKGPRQMGKTSLLNRYIVECQEQGKRWAFVDFQSFANRDLDDYLVFLNQLAIALQRGLELDDSSVVPPFNSQQEFSFFVEDNLVRKARSAMVLAFDEVERLLGRPYQQDFFSLLRAWHNARSNPLSVWDEVDLALVIATEPYLLIDRADQSPFNVTPPIELASFPRSALDQLNACYGGLLVQAELDQLFELLNGHPYLTRLAFYRLVAGTPMSFASLIEQAAVPDGPFGEHLRRMLLLLQEQAGLMAALRQVLAVGKLPDEDAYRRLHGAGLVSRQNGRIVPANLLYARFFKAVR